MTTPNLTIGSGNKIKFANNDYIRYDDANGVGRFHFDSDGGTNNSSVQAATFVGALSGNASTATSLATARTIAGTSFNGSSNIDISYNNLTNKPTIPTNNNQLTNGAGYVTTNTTYSVGDGGLTQNNFTNADHTKLNGIATGADVTPSWVPSSNPSYATQSYVWLCF